MTKLFEPPPSSKTEATGPRPGAAQAYQQAKPGSAAENELVVAHLPLVKTLVGRIAMTLPAHVDVDDLHSAGLVGLLNAVRQYDPSAGTSFQSYARVRIRGAIFDELRRLDWVPRSVHDKARKVQAAIQKLEQQTGEIPSATEIARELQLTAVEYEQLLEEIRPATFVSLDCGNDEEHEESARHECFADSTTRDPSDTASKNELSRMILERLKQLPEMQRKVLALYYFEDLRLREIAAVFGVTESRICQVHAQAILAIKAAIRRQEEVPA
jgi:RNA polymerase sigma factor for flagellar operon FliA